MCTSPTHRAVETRSHERQPSRCAADGARLGARTELSRSQAPHAAAWLAHGATSNENRAAGGKAGNRREAAARRGLTGAEARDGQVVVWSEGTYGSSDSIVHWKATRGGSRFDDSCHGVAKGSGFLLSFCTRADMRASLSKRHANAPDQALTVGKRTRTQYAPNWLRASACSSGCAAG